MTDFKAVTDQDYLAAYQQTAAVVQTALGPVQYAQRGDGVALLAVHGGPGGYDQGLVMAECFHRNGFRIIAPSRPGYLGTPLNGAATARDQADRLVALLDALSIDKIAVLGASAGGPPTYTLAQEHPDRVLALIEIDSVCMQYGKMQELTKAEELIYLSKPGLWMTQWLMQHFPETMIKSFLSTESSLDAHSLTAQAEYITHHADELALVRLLLSTMSERYSERQLGLDTDIAILTGLTPIPLDKVKCPTLILHGDADRDVELAHANYAHESITDSLLYLIKGGSHIGFWAGESAQRAQEYAVQWLKKVTLPSIGK